ncbi:FMN adenylyltransferase [Desulfatibacillum alkenivorans DSM 16219]|jgi:riboflavin kinase/FMN adenylyltransferase|uniref:Riboflavin biosynthesis protein n=1 Tax=Desulfatibacillum alkenivorans DSM 16219 TaxID=1121393 RepID=A0A1M6PH77_9BACT|nr:bifunctional riboflavin kinase/FAD synthetase [Desulfatibacillum alkenivorans]SHK07250.1 FMN adenylyltransferase [Desulfatibacillum alkenivorans DSM 16219]
MQLIENLEAIKQPFSKAVITIGNFDGVHIGHQALFSEVIQKADSIGGSSMAMTFEPHPARFLKKENFPPLITLYEQKVELISRTGLDALVVVPFNEAFASLSPREFVEDILIKRLGVKVLIVGPDYCFGKGREGNVEYLQQIAEPLDFELMVVPWIGQAGPDGERISSTRIRELVQDGKIDEAKRLLGRDYQVRGMVVKGRNRGGKLLGFPTANIHLTDELCPKTGVYAVTMQVDDAVYPAVANIGYSPTFDDYIFTVEVHALDFSGDLYDKKIKVNFIARLRGEIKFPNLDALIEQIQEDIKIAREIIPL